MSINADLKFNKTKISSKEKHSTNSIDGSKKIFNIEKNFINKLPDQFHNSLYIYKKKKE